MDPGSSSSFLEVSMKRAATTLALCFGLYASVALAADGAAPAQPEAAPAPAAEPAAARSSGGETAGADGYEAKETVCKNGKNVRKVKLGFADNKTGSECKVSYQKETEDPSGNEKVLWNARMDGKYCQQQAQGFVEKLKGQGWSCE
jgi:hypothetical protein